MNKPIENPTKKQNNFNEDTPIVLHSRDPNKEYHHAFYISLIANDKLLHNCMLDSSASSKHHDQESYGKVCLKITRPYQNVCAMDSREIDVVGIILNFPVKLVAYLDIGVTMDIVVIDVPIYGESCCIGSGLPPWADLSKWIGPMP